MSARRVPTRYFVLLRDALHAQRVDTAALLRMAGIDAERFDARDATLSPVEVEKFVASGRRLTGRTDLGFELGLQIKMTSHDLLGYGMLSCRSFDEVMRLVARHYHLMTEQITLRYRRVGSGPGEAVYTPATAMPLEMLRFYLEVLAIAHCNQVALMLRGDVPRYDAHLAMPEPPHLARYRMFAPARFHFDERALPGVRIVMGPDLLDRPLPLGDSRLLQDVDERCTLLGQKPPADDAGWGDYVRMMLRQSRGALLTLEELARRVQVSARTIDRHLRREELQFRDLAQQVRFERACELLTLPGATVAQVALDLGFSDAANFSRAFRRVVGVTPSEFRAGLPQRG